LGPPPGESTHWTGRELAKAAGVSLRSVQRILEAHQLAPHRIRTFKLSKDPEFVEKLRDIVGLAAASVVLILSYDRPFIGQLSIGPDSLLRVMPEAAAPPVVAARVAPPAPEAPAAAPPINPLEKPASKPVAHAGGVASAVFPSEISPAYAGEQASVARLKTCF
jgi:hypothetical protein